MDDTSVLEVLLITEPVLPMPFETAKFESTETLSLKASLWSDAVLLKHFLKTNIDILRLHVDQER